MRRAVTLPASEKIAVSKKLLTSTRHSACSSRLCRSRKRQLEKPRRLDPPPSAGSMKKGIAWSSLAKVVCDRAAQREHPGVPEERNVLDRLVLDLAEAVRVVGVREVVERHAVVAAAPRVARRRARVDGRRALRVQVGDLGAQARQRRGRVDLLDRRLRSPRPSADPTASSSTPPRQRTRLPRRPHVERGRHVRLLEAVVGPVILRGVGRPDAVEADLCRLPPAAEDRQDAAAVEQAGGQELGSRTACSRSA